MVKVGFPGGARLEWYDRNPISQLKDYEATSVAPHSPIERFSYTVPTGKKAFIETSFCEVLRVTAPSAAGKVLAHIQFYTTVEGAVNVMGFAFIDAAEGAGKELNVGLSGCLQASDKIMAVTGDASTGGACDYQLSAKITEFDA